jgi:CRP-like cAMP-binding protein
MSNTARQLLPQPNQRHLLEEIYRSDRQRIQEPRRVESYASGEVIWIEPDKVWVVCRGIVQLGVLHTSGDEVIVGLASPSMPFGGPLSILGAYNARALTAVELLCFSFQEIQESPGIAQELFPHLVRRLRQTEAILAISSHRRIEDRLRHLLLLLKQEIGQPTPAGIRLTIKLTHQQLANAIGTSRVTITRLLGKFRDENLIELDRDRHLVITSHANFA